MQPRCARLETPRRKAAVLGDDADNRILECAAAGGADVIVTGARAMLDLNQFQEIRILTPRQFPK